MADLGNTAQVTWSFAQSNQNGQPGGAFDAPLDADQQGAVRAALARWEEVCRIDFVEAGADSASVGLRFGMDAMDGQNNVLGQCSYFYNNGAFVSTFVRFDSAESWSYAGSGSAPGGTYSFYTVALHEIGHAIGLAHSSSLSALMAPAYNSSRLDLQAEDIAGGVYLYGATGGDSGASALADGGTAAPPQPSPVQAGTHLSGTGIADGIMGQAGNDTILGDGGNDTLSGASGADLVFGNQGNDLLYGGDDADTLFGGRDGDVLNGDNASDRLMGDLGNDRLDGGDGSDTLYGGRNEDTLHGGAGGDWLSGDLGNDWLNGGAGADLFVFRAGGGVDLVADFAFADGDRLATDGRVWSVVDGAAGAVVDFGSGDSVTLAGVAAGQVNQTWFTVA
ncbi:matrixin family metalloprotease [Azospirillum sp. SYSU D00513]|uniref:matrixin family metalloprotease n=1 Tax=Azospirillum sp. SYSU D00513 TaxID=2812561 RepID=UPI001A95B3FA|nr:matrixin family metalloprotease [Azospirillum sp. SYSU D00513]